MTSGLRRWAATVGLGVGRLEQLLQDDAVKDSLAPDAILQVTDNQNGARFFHV